MKIHTITWMMARLKSGTAGTDLTGWSIIPYNERWVLHIPIGIIRNNPNQSNGTVFSYQWFTKWSSDGLALVNNLGKLFSFKSYEGVFVATNGPANGMTKH
jgi:hypothetical protein